jgi:oxygen-independent coproporphyrinogen-3 oxidase
VFEKYIVRLCAEIEHSPETAEQMGASLECGVDTIYFGGGTPTLLDVSQLERVFVTIRQNFHVHPQAEITVECAPGTLSREMLERFSRNDVNRVSLGVQSFVDVEAKSVGRLHNRETVLNDIARLRSAGISNINVDLIAGLPHQTRESWEQSLDELISTGVSHASVYMLEVDEDSRLGRELIAGGQKYHAHFVPDEDLTADMYEVACERLNATGIKQYEISNFARPGFESKHNLKYWTRQPYLGFGVDAHSMLLSDSAQQRLDSARRDSETMCEVTESLTHFREGHDSKSCRTSAKLMDGTAESRALPMRATNRSAPNAIRFCNADGLESYLAGWTVQQTAVSWNSALQETCFLGLRLTEGLNLRSVVAQFGEDARAVLDPTIAECIELGLMEQERDFVRLTTKGRLLSNEVFEKFISLGEPIIV